MRGLPLDYRLMDDRDLDEPFVRILSIGMFARVGHKNYRTQMQMPRRSLKSNRLFLLHCIVGNVSVYKT